MATFAVINPATGETVAEYPEATAADIEQALSATQQAYQRYADWKKGQRALINLSDR